MCKYLEVWGVLRRDSVGGVMLLESVGRSKGTKNNPTLDCAGRSSFCLLVSANDCTSNGHVTFL